MPSLQQGKQSHAEGGPEVFRLRKPGHLHAGLCPMFFMFSRSRVCEFVLHALTFSGGSRLLTLTPGLAGSPAKQLSIGLCSHWSLFACSLPLSVPRDTRGHCSGCRSKVASCFASKPAKKYNHRGAEPFSEFKLFKEFFVLNLFVNSLNTLYVLIHRAKPWPNRP